MYKAYVIKYFLFTSMFSMVFLGNYFFIRNSGELGTYKEIINIQFEKTGKEKLCLYGSAIFDDPFFYKLEGYRKAKPDIVAFGSSRVLPFRETSFTGNFYNAGYVMSYLNEGKAFIEKMLALHKPKVIIFGIDFWWFNKDVRNPDYTVVAPSENNINLRVFTEPISWILGGKVNFTSYVKGIFTKDQSCHAGVAAIYHKNGYAMDGSIYYTSTVTGIQKDVLDANFSNTKSRIEKGIMKFQYGNKVSIERINIFIKILEIIKSNNVNVVLFFPPLANEIISTMKTYGSKYNYIQDLKNQLQQRNVEFYDFHDSKKLESSDCEFIDGFHGGDITYSRILKHIYENDLGKNNVLKPYINIKKVTENISHYANMASIPEIRLTNKPEVDFLEIGCSKTYLSTAP